MATRRAVASEKSVVEKDDTAAEKSDIAPAVPKDVIVKLLGFTFAMIVIPIGSYFLTVNTIFQGNSTWAGGVAALLANVVLLGYVIVAMNEDKSDRENSPKESKKEQ